MKYIYRNPNSFQNFYFTQRAQGILTQRNAKLDRNHFLCVLCEKLFLYFQVGLLYVLISIIWVSCLNANNVQIQNLTVEDGKLNFTVSWENAWNVVDMAEPNNHDAIWIFGKYRLSESTWQPLHFDQNIAEHESNTLDVNLQTTEDEMGMMLNANLSGSGNITANITLKIKEDFTANQDLQIRLFGIEMVYVPEGAFYVGDGLAEKSFVEKNTTNPFYIDSENTINIEAENGLSALDITTAPAQNIPPTYPKGYDAFYCMKYEITQQQYSDFLNTLTYRQQAQRTKFSPDLPTQSPVLGEQHRNIIAIAQRGWAETVPAQYGCDANENGVFNEPDDGQYQACNYLNSGDVQAYLDWAGLRPITELEYEKACRGPYLPIPKEFAWGTGEVSNATELIECGSAVEAVTDSIVPNTGLANYNYSPIDGPLRAGFAATISTNRQESGATYYGIMEMSGNVWEYCINVDEQGLLFTGACGDGLLDDLGDADISTWGTVEHGIGLRGGGWNSGDFQDYRDAAVSARFYAFFPTSMRRNTTGGRGGF